MSGIRSLALAATLWLVPLTAMAQHSGGTLIPVPTMAEPDGANSLIHNSAGLATLRSWELRVYNTQLSETSGQGTAVLFATPVFGPLFLGVAAEHVRPPSLDSQFRLSFGVGVTIHEMFRLGMVWRSISADTFNDADSLDAGFLIRPASWLSVGMTVRDINTPTLGGVVFPRVYGIGLGFRPGTDRVTMEAGVEVREDSGDVDFLARLRFEPVEGLEIQANVGIQPRGDDLLLDVGMSLALHFGHGGIEGGAFLRNAPGQKLFNGFTVGARVSGASYPKLYERQGRTVTIELGSVGETPRPGLFSEGSSFARQVVYLDAVGRDDVVEAIVIRDRGTGYGWAQTEEIRGLIDDIKARGKDVTVFLDQGDLRHMYMYASAHRIVLNPAGGLRLTGLSSTLTYYRDVLDKIQVDTQWVRFGKYKSAPESFFRVDPSDASREVRNSLLDGLYGHLTGGIAEGLGITKEAVQTIIDEGPYVANECKERGLVHHIAYWDEIQKTVEAARGQPIRFGSPSFARRQAREPWA
ncbi:MAG: protease-4, partial [Myxococcota bacterium]